MRAIAAALLLLLGGCATTPPAAIPDFAEHPDEPFSRQAAIVLALGEWHAFGAPVVDGPEDPAPAPDDKPERQDGLWQRVGLYWWIGVGADRDVRGWTGKHDARGHVFPASEDGKFAWSAAFISYLMRMAGAGDRFPYSAAHADYIDAARKASLGLDPGPALRAWPLKDYAPRPGDLVCFGRGSGGHLRFEDLPAGHFPGHCAIVVARDGAALLVIGGNVADSVALTHVPATADGRLAGADGSVLDRRHHWFVAIEVLYDR